MFSSDTCSALRFCVLLFTEGMPQPGLTPLWLHWHHAQLRRLRSICRRLSASFTKDSRSHKWIWCVVLCTEPGPPEISGACYATSTVSMHEIRKLLLPRPLACHACLNCSTFLWGRSLTNLIRSLLRCRFLQMHLRSHHAPCA